MFVFPTQRLLKTNVTTPSSSIFKFYNKPEEQIPTNSQTPCMLLRTHFPLSILCLRILGLIIRMHIMDMDSGGR